MNITWRYISKDRKEEKPAEKLLHLIDRIEKEEPKMEWCEHIKWDKDHWCSRISDVVPLNEDMFCSRCGKERPKEKVSFRDKMADKFVKQFKNFPLNHFEANALADTAIQMVKEEIEKVDDMTGGYGFIDRHALKRKLDE